MLPSLPAERSQAKRSRPAARLTAQESHTHTHSPQARSHTHSLARKMSLTDGQLKRRNCATRSAFRVSRTRVRAARQRLAFSVEAVRCCTALLPCRRRGGLAGLAGLARWGWGHPETPRVHFPRRPRLSPRVINQMETNLGRQVERRGAGAASPPPSTSSAGRGTGTNNPPRRWIRAHCPQCPHEAGRACPKRRNYNGLPDVLTLFCRPGS